MYKNQKLRFTLYCVSLIISGFFEVLIAYIMMKCIDLALDKSLEEAFHMGIFIIFYLAGYFLVDFINKKLKWKVLQNAQTSLRNDVIEAVFGLGYDRFHGKNSNAWVSVMTNDLDVVQESYFKMLLNMVTDIFMLGISSVLLFHISYLLFFFVLIMGGIQTIVPKTMGKKIAEKRKKQVEHAEGFTVTAVERLEAFDLLKTYRLFAEPIKELKHSNEAMEQAKFNVRVTSSLAREMSFTFGQILYIGIYLFGAILTMFGFISMGAMVAASQLVVYIASPMQTLSEDITEIKSAIEILDRIYELVLKEEDKDMEGINAPVSFSTLEGVGVSFGYDTHMVIERSDFRIKNGKKYLLKGASGTGKSTLINLLSGRVKTQDGRICIDDMDLCDIKRDELPKFISVCTQSTYIFNASVRDNITLFNDSIPDDKVNRAIERARLTYVVNRYEDGLNHIISQGGSSLSGGEKQRVALARMYLYNSQIMVFDESFANLDKESAKDLLEDVLDCEKTVIVISHQIEDNPKFDAVISIKDLKVCVQEK
ncbi:MAG: ABC transporter ATP-binding protein/permease [Lachnospiraceae bacterium]|nr:ABC transporter ATP-binding protein/permease [Lachnospiraceae bacterium]